MYARHKKCACWFSPLPNGLRLHDNTTNRGNVIAANNESDDQSLCS